MKGICLYLGKSNVMRYIFFLLISFIVTETFAQTIPYASQQSKWIFPIWAKDATGAMDTIYLCYDPNTTGASNDLNYGEIWFDSPSDFFMSTYSWGSALDSAKRVDSRDTLNNQLGYYFEVHNAVFPITFYWDVDLLRSDSIPYPFQPDYPKAWFGLDYGSGSYMVYPDSTFSCNPSYPVIVSDTVNPADCPCHVRDSLTLEDWTGNPFPQSGGFEVSIDPWHSCSSSISEINSFSIKTYPNPFSDILYLNNQVDLIRVEILNIDGRFILSKEVIENLITLNELAKGTYLIKFISKTKIYEPKLIFKN